MKRAILTIAAAALLCFSAAPVNSQAPQPVTSGTLLSQLKAIQAANKALIEKQEKTLQSLDELKAVADQLKTLGKRG